MNRQHVVLWLGFGLILVQLFTTKMWSNIWSGSIGSATGSHVSNVFGPGNGSGNAKAPLPLSPVVKAALFMPPVVHHATVPPQVKIPSVSSQNVPAAFTAMTTKPAVSALGMLLAEIAGVTVLALIAGANDKAGKAIVYFMVALWFIYLITNGSNVIATFDQKLGVTVP